MTKNQIDSIRWQTRVAALIISLTIVAMVVGLVFIFIAETAIMTLSIGAVAMVCAILWALNTLEEYFVGKGW